MDIEYDSEADALYIRFRQDKPVNSVDIEEGVTVDLDGQKHLVGVEILNASRRLPSDALSAVTVRNLLTAA